MSHDANPFHEYPPGLKIDLYELLDCKDDIT
jgi:hypothetical protein